MTTRNINPERVDRSSHQILNHLFNRIASAYEFLPAAADVDALTGIGSSEGHQHRSAP
jgi:hypothetical protein